MKNYKLKIKQGSGAMRAILIKRLRRDGMNTVLCKFFLFSPEALKPVRRTQIPFIIYRLSFIIYNLKKSPPGKKDF
jgi:hypothetical protein